MLEILRCFRISDFRNVNQFKMYRVLLNICSRNSDFVYANCMPSCLVKFSINLFSRINRKILYFSKFSIRIVLSHQPNLFLVTCLRVSDPISSFAICSLLVSSTASVYSADFTMPDPDFFAVRFRVSQ